MCHYMILHPLHFEGQATHFTWLIAKEGIRTKEYTVITTRECKLCTNQQISESNYQPIGSIIRWIWAPAPFIGSLCWGSPLGGLESDQHLTLHSALTFHSLFSAGLDSMHGILCYTEKSHVAEQIFQSVHEFPS